jgi:hypothetical protein
VRGSAFAKATADGVRGSEKVKGSMFNVDSTPKSRQRFKNRG